MVMKERKTCLLGIDMGTSSVKAGLFDIYGNPLGFADGVYPLYTPQSGWAEQKADEWWNTVAATVRRLIAGSGVCTTDIIGMSVDTTCCTVVLMDEHMNVLRPAIMWMDVRASGQAKRITATGHDMLKFNGYGNVSAETMPAKALWLKENERETYDKARYVVECTDWLMYRLTGEMNASISCAAARWYYDRPGGGFREDFYGAFGLEDVLEKFPPQVVDMGVRAGTLNKEAAVDLGLPEGLPVGEGGADAFVGMIGLDVVSPGKIAMITGSSHLHLGLVENELHSQGMWGSYPDAIVPGLQLIEGGQTSTGSMVSWFQSNFCSGVEQEAREQGKSVYDLLNEGAQKLPIGAEGLLLLDYFQGNRTPHADPDVRGMLYGLSLKHTPYHIYRAMIEGICFGTENVMQAFRKSGTGLKGIYTCGGAAASRFWMQTHADVCNLPIYVPAVTQAPCLGAAILGAVAAGVYPDIKKASAQMVKIKETIQPDSGRHEEYRFYFEKYIEAYDTSKNWMHKMTEKASNIV